MSRLVIDMGSVNGGKLKPESQSRKAKNLQPSPLPGTSTHKGIERPSNIAAVDETSKKAPESKKKQGQQKEFGP